MRKRTHFDQITDDNSQQVLQDESSTESIMSSITSARRTAILLAIALMFVTPLCPRLLADDDHNPIGVTGTFEGVITTGCAYNVLNHNATRQIDDIVVPGAVGKYGLKMTRYYNSRSARIYGIMGAGWSHEYRWIKGNDNFEYPNGNVWDSHCTGDWGLGGPLGVSDWPSTWNGYSAFRLADGGTVVFENPNWGVATKIIDPYGQMTTITLDTNSGQITRVTEPGGRYLQFIYSTQDGQTVLHEVDAYDRVGGSQIDSVVYNYASKSTGGNILTTAVCLTSVDYSDGTTHAYYTYQEDNSPENPTPPCPCPLKLLPVLRTCQDVRYKGPMRQICYDYQDKGPHGAITAERYSLNGSTNGSQVSKIDPPAPSPLSPGVTFPTTYTETRGDGPTRTFNYTALSIGRPPPEEECPGFNGPAPQQFLQSYTDFQNHTTQLGYDGNWYVNSVTDANLHNTSYLRGPPPNAYPGPTGIGQILKITHHDGTHIDYTYQTEPGAIGGHYVATVSDERQKVTTYTRDPTTHLVMRIDFPSDVNTPVSYEEFTYNGFGQVLTHHLKNGAWESFVYDGRGLLTDKYNPKQSGVPTGADPHTHYDYYTSTDGKLGWIDRVKKVTLPANDLGNIASETYEYDRTLDAGGITNLAGAAVGGRGLVTKITHADNTYQQFKYDAYGNKRWQDNELRQASNYTYDDYNRLLTAKDPLLKTATYTYTPTNGGGGPSYKHTTTNPDSVTTPTGIKTTNVYDANFRKTSTTAAYGTALAATTWFHYDAVGNQDYVTDPRGTSSPGIYTTYTDYDSRNRKWQVREPLGRTTQFYYDDGINITRIIRPDNTTETKTYDALNRVLSDTVPKTANPVVNLTTSFTYNPSGTIQKVTDPNLHYTWLYYDASDRRFQMTYHDGSTQFWAYDDAGNLESRITVNGETQWFYYDNRNFKYANWWSNWDDSVRTPDWCFFDYDAAGRLTEAENGTNGWGANIISDVHRYYDAAGHLTQEQQIITGLYSVYVNYPTYDDDGRLTRMNVSGVAGYDFTYSYDAMGRFEKIFVTNGAQLFQYYYDAASNETQRDNIVNQVNQVYPRDALNRITTWDAKKGTTTLAHEGYTYDSMNRITLVAYPNPEPSDSFQYYLDGELKIATLSNLGHNITYNLDNKGNRTSVVDNNVTSSYSPNTIDQYTTGAGLGVTNGPEHEIKTYGGVTYTYINDERLKSAAAGTTYSMVYDALGRCMKRSITSGQENPRPTVTPRPTSTPHGSPSPSPTPSPMPSDPTTYYIYDGEKPILEYDANTGASVGVNVYGKGVDEILERVAIGSDSNWYTYYPQQNHEGSVTLLTDTGGGVLERYRYDAFGAPTIYTGTWGTRASTIYDNRFLFTGREYAATYRSTTNAAFNFYEYRARAYNPKLGRFMSEDPKLFVHRINYGAAPSDWSFSTHPDEAEFNLFRYCGNDPIDFTDPMGLDAMANAMEVAEAVVPGQYEYNQILANFQSGNYGNAAGWGVTWVSSTVVGVVSGTTSTRLQAGLRAAETAAARRTVAAVIGKYLDTPSYVDVGKHLNKSVLDVPTRLWEKMSSGQKWAATQKFLDSVIAQKGDFLFNKSITSIASQSGDFRKELEYVSQKGYVLSKDGWSMTRIVDDAAPASTHVPLPVKP